MSLRTNSKKAIQNVRAYILDNFNPEGYSAFDGMDRADFAAAATMIHFEFIVEKGGDLRFKAGRIGEYELFKDWCAGLPGILDTCYYYNRSALKDVQNILEQSDAEAARFTESQAEELLTSLIFREIVRVVKA